jgi:hypothetical protein
VGIVCLSSGKSISDGDGVKKELMSRTSIQLAEQERRGGIANRVSPMISTSDPPLTRSRVSS